MNRTAWILLLSLRLPAGDPFRIEALELLADELANEMRLNPAPAQHRPS